MRKLIATLNRMVVIDCPQLNIPWFCRGILFTDFAFPSTEPEFRKLVSPHSIPLFVYCKRAFCVADLEMGVSDSFFRNIFESRLSSELYKENVFTEHDYILRKFIFNFISRPMCDWCVFDACFLNFK